MNIHEVQRNIKTNMAHGYPLVQQTTGRGALAICATGPSLSIRPPRNMPVMALHHAYDWIWDNGRSAPTYGVMGEALPTDTFIESPIKISAFFFASRVNPETFDRFTRGGHDVKVYHSGDYSESELDICADNVGGAGTFTSDVLNLAVRIGYDELHLYGMDFCSINGLMHQAHPTSMNTLTNLKPIEFCGETFMTENGKLRQLEAAMEFVQEHPDIKVTAHGDGLLARWMKKREVA